MYFTLGTKYWAVLAVVLHDPGLPVSFDAERITQYE